MPLQYPIAAVPVDPRLEPIFFSSFAGVDPSGATDSSAAFNTAISFITANQALIIGPGVYLLGGTALTAIPANCTVIGSGEYSTQINTALASGTLFTLSGATGTIANMAITNTNGSNTAAAISMAANQTTAYNLSITGFGSTTGCLTLTAAATAAQANNVFVSSSVANAVGMSVAGADTSIQGCYFLNLATGMACAANDRFAVVDTIFKTCTTGLSVTATSAAGSTTFDGCQFDGCTTGLSIAPGTGAAVQAAIFDGCVWDGNTTSVSIAPTSTGTVNYCSIDGGAIISTVNSASGITVNGAGANSVQYITIDGVDIVCSGTSSVGFTYTAGGNAAAPISFVNCDMNSTTNVSAAVGSANNLPYVFRFCPGVNPVGKLSSQPATSASAVTNNTGCDVTVALVIGSTATTLSIGGQSAFGASQTSVNQLVRVPYGQTITTSQTTGVTWIWFGD